VIAEGVAEHLDHADLEMLANVDRDEHGHIRLAEVPLGDVLRDAVRKSLTERGVKTAILSKDLGYELRCADPCAFDQDYTRDLGSGAVGALLAGESQVLVTRQGGSIVTVPFADLMDATTGRTSVRNVDITTDSYATARALQVRLTAEDLTDEDRLAAIAAAANLAPAAMRESIGELTVIHGLSFLAAKRSSSNDSPIR
jgi:6-phosphofructokinase 1